MAVALVTHRVIKWAKLAWVASMKTGTKTVSVYHGPNVEIGDEWCTEAVWAGSYELGDIDLTEHVFGTGIRCRDGRVVFVSSGTMLDRLWYCRRGERIFVANSLPALLACANLSLLDDYHHYPADIMTLTQGLNNYKSTIPATPCDVSILYYRNLEYDGHTLIKVDKPDTTPDFRGYMDYHDFLIDVAERLGSNLGSPLRQHRIVPLSNVSSGYDAGAASAIARRAGCTDTVSIINAASLLPRNDSGAEVAKHLYMSCKMYGHSPAAYRYEETIWSAAGQPAGLNLTIFDYPEPLCLFFTGYRGDTVWDGRACKVSEPLSAPTISGLGICEFRLFQGLFHCPVPCWGNLRAEQIQAISTSSEMYPWRLNQSYDRPIPRRILEQAGVPRHLFGIRKAATSTDCFFLWPFASTTMTKFNKYLQTKGIMAPSDSVVSLLRKSAHLATLMYSNTPKKLRSKLKDPRILFTIHAQSMLFQWANHELKNVYFEPFQNNPESCTSQGALEPRA